MNTPIRTILLAAVFGSSLLAGRPASALPAGASNESLSQARVGAYPGEGYSQYRYGRRYSGGYRRRGGGGAGIAAGVIGGLAAGAIIGGAIASSQAAPAYGPGVYGPGVYGPGGYGPAGYGPGAPVGNVYGRDPNQVSYCASRYRSYDPASGTYVARDGNRYPCE